LLRNLPTRVASCPKGECHSPLRFRKLKSHLLTKRLANVLRSSRQPSNLESLCGASTPAWDGGIRRALQKLGKVCGTRCVHSAGAVFIAAPIYLQATGYVVARHVITNDNLTRRMHQLEVLHSAPTVRARQDGDF